MNRLSNKIALITGGTTGIGLAAAKAFLAEGARVAVTGQNLERLKEAAEILGSNVLTIQANQASVADIEHAAAIIKQQFGTLDILFINAGIAKPAALADIVEADVANLFSVNFNGVLFTIQKMRPLLCNPASVILTSTTLTEQGLAGMSVYSASKAATRSLARTLSTELIPDGIRINVISPGPIETPIYGKIGLSPSELDQFATNVLSKVPMARFGQVEEIAGAVVFLASNESSYMAGQEIVIDGGMAAL